jgi:hypothetical protein
VSSVRWNHMSLSFLKEREVVKGVGGSPLIFLICFYLALWVKRGRPAGRLGTASFGRQARSPDGRGPDSTPTMIKRPVMPPAVRELMDIAMGGQALSVAGRRGPQWMRRIWSSLSAGEPVPPYGPVAAGRSSLPGPVHQGDRVRHTESDLRVYLGEVLTRPTGSSTPAPGCPPPPRVTNLAGRRHPEAAATIS